MRGPVRRIVGLFVVFLAALSLHSFAFANPPNPPKAGAGPAKASTPVIPENASPGQVEAFLAGLSDEQARKLLQAQMKREAAANQRDDAEIRGPGREGGLGPLFRHAESSLAAVFKRVDGMISGADTALTGWPQAWARLTGGKGIGQFAATVAVLLLIVFGGLAAERALLRGIAGMRDGLMKTLPLGRLQKIGFILSRMLIDGLGIACYLLVTFALFVVIYDPQDAGHPPVSTLLVISYYYRLILFAARIILSPEATGLRLAPMSDADAVMIYGWMKRIVAVCGLLAAVAIPLKEAGISRDVFLLIFSSVGLAVSALLIAFILQSRERVARAIAPSAADSQGAVGALRIKLAGIWHYIAILYAAVIGIYWSMRMLTLGDVTILNLIYSLFLIPFFIGADQWIQKLLKIASGESREIIDLSESEAASGEARAGDAERKDIRPFVPLVRKAFRAVLAAFFFFAMLRLWGFDIELGRLVARDVLSVFVILIVGLITWQVIKARIDQKLREETPVQVDDADEGGWSVGSRSATLLLLLRKFLLVALFVILALTILSSLGVNIAPLIAGAGVVGLAIGFGSQTLVKDIIAGVFFLIDDAFRVGDYVEAGSAKGAVEQISLRSIKLRHPRGMLYTVPFGTLKTITNFSRDYIITKLDFRVRYDADLEKIRKIVKKINKEIMQDEEIKRVLLSDIKSTGVREMDDSAMILRVKFKTVPGEQFKIRREVFQRVQKAFHDSGIEFAHRNVTVYLPPEIQSKSSGDRPEDPKKAAETGAAGPAAQAQTGKEATAIKDGRSIGDE